MAGTYDPNSPPVRPGFYSLVKATAAAAVQAGNGAVVVIPVVHDWGPEAVATKITSMADFDRIFGPTADDDRFAVYGALKGDGTTGSGASAVYVYKMPLSGNAAGTKTLQNTTPATALTLTAKSKGTYGNTLRFTTRAHPTDGTQAQLLILSGTTLLETWSYLTTDIANLAAQLNDTKLGSNYVTAVANITGVALATVSASAMTGATSGTVGASDFSAALTGVEGVAFNIITFANLTDATTLAACRTWLSNLNRNVRKAMMVTGGLADETISTANIRSALSYTQPEIVNHGFSTYIDISDGVTQKSSAQMAGFIAGIIAGAATKKHVTFSRVPGYTLKVRPSNDQVVAAINGGTLITTQDDAGVRIEKQITTYTDTSNVIMPKAVYSSILSVRVLQRIDTDLTYLTEQNFIGGGIKNSVTAQDAFIGALTGYFTTLETEGVLWPGQSTVLLDPTKDNSGDTWYPVYTVKLEKAVERVLAVGVVS